MAVAAAAATEGNTEGAPGSGGRGSGINTDGGGGLPPGQAPAYDPPPWGGVPEGYVPFRDY